MTTAGLQRRRARWSISLAIAAISWFGFPQGWGVSIGSSLAEQGHQVQLSNIFRTILGHPILRVVTRADAGVQPKSVRVSPDGDLVYVCNFGRPNSESVTIHDAETLARVGVIEFPGNAVESLFSPDGRTLYVSNFRRHVIEVIDVETRRVVTELAVARHPKTMALSPDGSILYVASWADRQVSVVDLETGEVLRQLRTGENPRGMLVHRDGRLLVASFNSHYIQEFEAGGGRLRRRFRTCQFPRHLSFGHRSGLLYVTCSQGSVEFYDPETGLRAGVSGVGHNPRSMDVSSDGRYIATADFGLGGRRSGSVTLIDTVSETHHITIVPHVERFVGISVRPEPNLRIYATSWDRSEVFAFEL